MSSTLARRPIKEITMLPVGLEAFVARPEASLGMVIFAHGSGSGRLSPRNNYVADGLHDAGLATLLLDLLTPKEAEDRTNIFNIPLLAQRLKLVEKWVEQQGATARLPIGFFGASTGAGAALLAAADPGSSVAAVVSRGGRPDLAGPRALAQVRAPTLLIVGGRDLPVIDLNRKALLHLRAEKQMVIVPGAHYLFEEPGALDQVLDYATRWFVTHLTRGQG